MRVIASSGALGSTWGHSSVGRAPALQAGGRRFDPVCLHQFAGVDNETSSGKIHELLAKALRGRSKDRCGLRGGLLDK
jgi:hypothetical protein